MSDINLEFYNNILRKIQSKNLTYYDLSLLLNCREKRVIYILSGKYRFNIREMIGYIKNFSYLKYQKKFFSNKLYLLKNLKILEEMILVTRCLKCFQIYY